MRFVAFTGGSRSLTLQGDTLQGNTPHVHPILVFLVVVAGGALEGIFGVVVAVPTLVVLRIPFDFLHVRPRIDDRREGAGAELRGLAPLHGRRSERRLSVESRAASAIDRYRRGKMARSV